MKPLFIVLLLLALAAGGAFAVFSPPIDLPTAGTLPMYGTAPELTEIAGWINTQPLTLESLRGKVVLIDFWTYSCINCIRTLPTLKAWDEKYRDKGLVIVGVHTPEFAFEKDYANVQKFVTENAIHYPVALDNDYGTWQAFQNSYWPRKYLIDREGKIRYDHIGEGGYDETERAIQELLGVDMDTTGALGEQVSGAIGTPELYLGSQFIRSPIGNPEGLRPGEVTIYADQASLQPNTVYLSGAWLSRSDAVESYNGSMQIVYRAKRVNIVAGGQGTLRVFVDGLPATGEDAPEGVAVIGEERLYNVVVGEEYEQHVIRLDVSPGVLVYTFTFG